MCCRFGTDNQKETYSKAQISEVVRTARRRGVVIVPEFDPFTALGFPFDFGREQHGPLHLACPDCDDRFGSCYVVRPEFAESLQGGPSGRGTQFIDIKLKVVPQLKRNSFCNVNKSFSSTRCTTLYYLRKNTRVHVIVELEIQQNSFSRVAPSDSSTCRISAMWHGRHDLVPLASPAFSAEQPMGGGCARRKGKWAADVDEGAGVGADVCGGSAKMG